jgi:trimeric autotransporter adhesin
MADSNLGADAGDAYSSAAKSFSSPIKLPASVMATLPAPVPAAAPSAPSAAPSSTSASASASASPDDLARRVQNDKAVMRQAAAQQSQALRAIAHRAAAEMEGWRERQGAAQVGELLLYWGLWAEWLGRACEVNDRILAYMRGYAHASAVYAASLTAASAHLTPISGGAIADLAGRGGGGSGPSSAAASAAGATASSSSSSGAGAGSGGGAASSAASVAASNAAAKRAGHDATAGGRLALSVSVVTSALQDLVGQAHGLLVEAATQTATQVVGDDDASGKHPARRTVPRAEVEGRAAPSPASVADLAGVTAYFEAVAADLRREGNALATSLAEASTLAEGAFGEFEGLTHAFMTGDVKRTKGKDLWIAELKYRRVLRGLLAVKQAYLNGMAGVYERYRRAESLRSEATARAIDAHAASVAKLYDRVSAKAVVDAVRALNTHADFSRVVEEEARARILSVREEARRASALAAASAAGAAAAKAGALGGAAGGAGGAGATSGGAYHAYHATALAASASSGEGGSGGGGGGGGGGGAHHIHFTLEAAPAVISPVASPLIVRTGLLLRQSGIMKSWKQCIGV